MYNEATKPVHPYTSKAISCIKNIFTPTIIVQASEAARNYCSSHLLTPAELLSPFIMPDKKASEMTDSYYERNDEAAFSESPKIEKIKLVDLEEWEIVSDKYVDFKFKTHLKRGAPNLQDIESLNPYDYDRILEHYGNTLGFEMLEAYLWSLSMEHDFASFNQCLGLIVLISDQEDISILDKIIKKEDKRLKQALGKDILTEREAPPPLCIIMLRHNRDQNHKDLKSRIIERSLNSSIVKVIDVADTSENSKDMTRSFNEKVNSESKWLKFIEPKKNINKFIQANGQEQPANLIFDSKVQPGSNISSQEESGFKDAFNDIGPEFIKKFSSNLKQLWAISAEKKKSIKKGFMGLGFFKKEDPISTDKDGKYLMLPAEAAIKKFADYCVRMGLFGLAVGEYIELLDSIKKVSYCYSEKHRNGVGCDRDDPLLSNREGV